MVMVMVMAVVGRIAGWPVVAAEKSLAHRYQHRD